MYEYSDYEDEPERVRSRVYFTEKKKAELILNKLFVGRNLVLFCSFFVGMFAYLLWTVKGRKEL